MRLLALSCVALLFIGLVTAFTSSSLGQEEVDCKFRRFKLPFRANQLAVSQRDGLVVAATETGGSRSEQYVASLDIETGELLGLLKTKSAVFDIAIAGSVFLKQNDRIAQATRRLAIMKTVPIEGSFSKRDPMRLSGNRLSIDYLRRFQLPELEPIPQMIFSDLPDNFLDGPTGFGWLQDGVLWDSNFKKPQLLAFPYKFRRAVEGRSFASRERGEFQLSANTWHPASFHLSKRPLSSQLATNFVTSKPFSLGIQQVGESLSLASYRLDNGNQIAFTKLPVQLEHRWQGSMSIAASESTFVVAVNEELFVGDLSELDGTTTSPFHIVPKQSAMVLSANAYNRVRYFAEGATRYRLFIDDILVDGEPAEQRSDNGEFDLNVSQAIDRILELHASIAANDEQGRRQDNRERVKDYARHSAQVYEELFDTTPEGIPFPLGVRVIAEGPKLTTASLAHDYLFLVSQEQFEEVLDKKYPQDRNAWKRPVQQVNTENYPPNASAPQGRQSPFRFHRELWQRSSLAKEAPLDSLNKLAADAKQKGDQRLQELFSQWHPIRTWTDSSGHQLLANLIFHFGDKIILRDTRGLEHTLTPGQLSPADQTHLTQSDSRKHTKGSSAWREFLFSSTLLAIQKFELEHGALPNYALRSESGQPRLSWRVLLLPQIGYAELFELFRFDQPWNSPHNRELLDHMPAAFDLSGEGETTRTNLQTIVSGKSALGGTFGLTRKSFGKETEATIVLLETVQSRAVPWTSPRDIELYELGAPQDTLRLRERSYKAGMLNGSTLDVPLGTERQSWKYLVEKGDGFSLSQIF